MTVLYIHQYFRIPSEGGAIRSYHLAKGMVEAGHRVIMLTGYDDHETVTITVEGIEVHYLHVPYSNAMGALSRIGAFLKFVRLALRASKKIKADLAYVSSTPLTVGLIALYLRHFRGLRYVFEVRDLWPEAPIQMGMLRNRLLKWLLRKLEKETYAKAEAVVALSPGMMEGVKKVWPTAETVLIPNFSDCDFFRMEEKDHDQMETLGLSPEKFIISYIGTLGVANGLDHVLEMAVVCRQEALDAHFIICGEGAENVRLKKNAENKSLHNLTFLTARDKEGIGKLLRMSDATLCTFKDIPILQTNSPNKFFDSLAAGRMVIVNTRGWLRELVETHHCGFYASPNHVENFPKQLNHYIQDPEKTYRFGRNARILAESKFSKKEMQQRVVAIIESSMR